MSDMSEIEYLSNVMHFIAPQHVRWFSYGSDHKRIIMIFCFHPFKPRESSASFMEPPCIKTMLDDYRSFRYAFPYHS